MFTILGVSISKFVLQVSVLNGGLRELYLQYRQRASFLMVYILEAHAKDEWPLGVERSSLPQHLTHKDRVAALRKLLSEDKHGTFSEDLNCESGIPVVVDTMENKFNELFAAWPERAYVIKNGKLDLITYPEDGYLHECARKYLQQL
ncbi:type I iodothyronine deiodinase-like [Liolophura sinensis]|uniref:type I iodothyronine deiodinase-like n=1 Tax=Liolophura sinensis TaxID=3198878 RepID=UPI0031588FF0